MPHTRRPVERLTRGLVAAAGEGGVFLSWRFLGDEPDGISWNVYRDGDLIATIEPRDVAPESDYPENPGVVKKNTTPTNFTDASGSAGSTYEIAPVVDGAEGEKQGMSVPMLSALAGTGEGQQGRGAVLYVPLKPAPEPVPLAHFTYRGHRFGPGQMLEKDEMLIPGTGEHWYSLDMDLLREFREAHDAQTPVSEEQLANWRERLLAHTATPNAVGVAARGTAKAWQERLENGRVTDALYAELEAEFIAYVKNVDMGEHLPYALGDDGSIVTTMSRPYETQDMTVGDFDGDGEYEIVVKWRSTQQDPMYSEPIYNGNNTTTAPEYIDAYKLDGTLLFRIDMGYNERANNDHSTTLMVEDFDGDGRAELMIKTALGTRIGHWDEERQEVVFPDTPDTVVGGEDGLRATTPAFETYFREGETASLDTYWSLLNSFSICYRTPTAAPGNDGLNDPALKRWIKTYHVGPMGYAKGEQEFFSAFRWSPERGGEIIDSAPYPFTYEGSVDGDDWAMAATTQRGNFSYLAFPGPGVGEGDDDYKQQLMAEREAYWLANPWKEASYGDAQGNRANRYLGVVASLDGEHQFAISQRGYYARTTLTAFRIQDDRVVQQALFDSRDSQYWSLGGSAEDYEDRGNHFTATADLDGDGRDEIVLKAMVLRLSDDGTRILPVVINGDTMPTIRGVGGVPPVPGEFEFATDEIRTHPANEWAALRHGDRSALLPVDRHNTIVQWSGSEESLYDDRTTGEHFGWIPGAEAHHPLKGRRRDDNGEIIEENAMIFGVYAGFDDEGTVAGNFSNRWPGAQGYSTNGARSMVTGELLAGECNLGDGQNAIWFGGGLTAMGVRGADISTIDDATFEATPYLETGLISTGNKSTPTLKADLFGDWREEIILRDAERNRLAIVTTLAPTQYGIRTLMHDPMYRTGVANKNTGYDQVGFASFYLGDEAELPTKRDDIVVRGE